MKKLLLVLGLVAGLLLLTPSAALACSCVHSDVAQHVARARTVVDATLTWGGTNEIDTYYGIDVHAVYKGRAASTEKLSSSVSTASCGLGELATHKRYLFFIDGEHPGRLTVTGCGGTTAYNAGLASRIAAITGTPTGPNATLPTAIQSDDPTAGTSVWTVVTTAAVLALVIAGLLYLRKRVS